MFKATMMMKMVDNVKAPITAYGIDEYYAIKTVRENFARLANQLVEDGIYGPMDFIATEPTCEEIDITQLKI